MRGFMGLDIAQLGILKGFKHCLYSIYSIVYLHSIFALIQREEGN